MLINYLNLILHATISQVISIIRLATIDIMHYTPREVGPQLFDPVYLTLKLTILIQVEKLLFSEAGRLAQRRLVSGVRLNRLEATVSATFNLPYSGGSVLLQTSLTKE
jgi:hypothetical protein